ncbi:MAG TPA: glycosyltransferase family A protein, partial [Opitutaceae bacterium]|nr:glycosyltransferase family A protein [Opitutaceae bacterium]
MSSTPLITFGIPAFRRPALLAETLASLAAQEGDWDFEVVVCDDAGLPETRRAVENFSARPISYHPNSPPLGAVANWNRCLELARGRWTMVLHEDDALYPWYLRLAAPHLREGIAAVCTQTVQGPAPPPLTPPARAPAARAYAPRF